MQISAVLLKVPTDRQPVPILTGTQSHGHSASKTNLKKRDKSKSSTIYSFNQKEATLAACT